MFTGRIQTLSFPGEHCSIDMDCALCEDLDMGENTEQLNRLILIGHETRYQIVTELEKKLHELEREQSQMIQDFSKDRQAVIEKGDVEGKYEERIREAVGRYKTYLDSGPNTDAETQNRMWNDYLTTHELAIQEGDQIIERVNPDLKRAQTEAVVEIAEKQMTLRLQMTSIARRAEENDKKTKLD